MAELVGRAEIRVEMNTAAAVRSLQQMAARADGPLRQLKRRITDVRREMAGLRGTSVAVTVDDRTGPGVTAVKAAVRDLERLGPVRIRVDVDAQTAEITRAARAMRDLRNDATGTSQALGALTIRATASTTALRALASAASRASRELGTLSVRAAAAAAALGVLSVQARGLRGQLHDLDGALRNVGSGMGGLRGRLGTVSTSAAGAEGNVGGLVTALVSLASAAIPVAAAVVPVAANLGAAGVALGAFGGAVAGQIVSLVELKEAEDKAAEATANHGAGSKQAAEAQTAYRVTLNGLPPATRRAAVAFGLLTEQYRGWSDALAKDTMPVVTKSMAVFGALLPRLTPLVRGTSTELDRLMSVLGGIVQADAVGRLSNQFAEFASGAISRATTRLAAFAQTANTGRIGENYREFMAYVRANGPIVSSTLSELGSAAVRIVVGFSDLGVSVLTVVNALARMVNAIPSGALSTFIQMAVAVKLLRLSIAGLTAVLASGAVAQLRLFTRAAVSGGVAAALQGLSQRMSGLQKAALGLGVLAVAAVGINELAKRARGAPPDVDRLTTALKRLGEAGQFGGELRKTFGDVDGLVKKIKQLQAATEKAEQAAGAGTGFRIPGLDDLADKIAGATDDMVKGGDSLNALKDDFKSVDAALAGLATSGHAKTAAESFSVIKQAAVDQGVSVKELNKLFPEYREAVAATKAEQALVAASMGLFGQQAQATSAKLKEQKASADGLRQAIQALNDVNRAAQGGMIAFEQAIDDSAKAVSENAGALKLVNGELDLSSQKARDVWSAQVDLAAKTDEAAASARDNGRSWSHVNGIYKQGREQLIKNLMQQDLNRESAEKLANQILKTPDKTARLKGNIEDLKVKVADAQKRLKDKNLTQPEKTKLRGDLKDIQAKIAEAKKRLKEKGLTRPERTKIRADIKDLQTKVASAKKELRNKKLTNPSATKIRATIADLKSKITSAKARLRNKNLTDPQRTKIRANISDLQRKVNAAQRKINSLRGRTVGIGVRVTSNVSLARTQALLEGRAQGGLIGYADGGPVRGYPHGGIIRGRGTGTSDSNLIMASRGEFMIRQAAVRRYGTGLFEALNAMQVPKPTRTARRTPVNVGVSTLRRGTGRQAVASTTVTYKVTVENRGVLGSQMEVENWLAKSLDHLDRTGRLPAAVGGR